MKAELQRLLLATAILIATAEAALSTFPTVQRGKATDEEKSALAKACEMSVDLS